MPPRLKLFIFPSTGFIELNWATRRRLSTPVVGESLKARGSLRLTSAACVALYSNRNLIYSLRDKESPLPFISGFIQCGDALKAPGRLYTCLIIEAPRSYYLIQEGYHRTT